jgi:phage terminase Nu1 subunit (DNA packaging protein)
MAERYVSREEIADRLGVEPRTVTNWVRNHSDFPSRVEGRSRSFPAQKCLLWFIDRKVADAVSSMLPPQQTSMVDAELRKAVADAELAELRVQKLRGEVIPVEMARKELRLIFTRLRARLISAPGEYAPQILNLGTVADAVLKLREVCSNLIAEMQSAATPAEDDDADEEDSNESEGSSGEAPE